MDIKKIIRERGFTVKEVANKLGISSPSLSDAINGNPTVEKLQKIANVLGCSVADFFEPSKKEYFTCPKCGEKIEIKN